jgi:site-specific recombinase XerD
MGHAFAKKVVRRNPDDAGLNYAQKALGHTSIATTGAYLKQDISAMVKALRRVNPLGR